MCHLTEAELRVCLYIMRRTFGFKKRADAISFNQFLKGITTRDGDRLDDGCGLKSSSHLSAALAALEEKGVIIRRQQYDIRGGKQPTVYLLRFRQHLPPDGQYPTAPSEVAPTARGETTLPPLGRIQETGDQETGDQETGKHSTSKGSSLERFIGEVSKEFGDLRHAKSNRTRVSNLAVTRNLSEREMQALCERASEATGSRTGLERPMAYFFQVLEELVERAPKERKSLAGRYAHLVRR
jgi:hypothetical protein